MVYSTQLFRTDRIKKKRVIALTCFCFIIRKLRKRYVVKSGSLHVDGENRELKELPSSLKISYFFFWQYFVIALNFVLTAILPPYEAKMDKSRKWGDLLLTGTAIPWTGLGWVTGLRESRLLFEVSRLSWLTQAWNRTYLPRKACEVANYWRKISFNWERGSPFLGILRRAWIVTKYWRKIHFYL